MTVKRRQRSLALACALTVALGGASAQQLADDAQGSTQGLLRVKLHKTAAEERTAWRSLGGEVDAGLTTQLLAEGGTDVVSLLNFMDAQV